MTGPYSADREFGADGRCDYICARGPRYRMLVALASLCIALVGLFAGSSAAETDASHKKPKPTPCAPSISKCGCTITTTGFYQVTKSLGPPGGALNEVDQSCIAVSAPRVGLYLAGVNITNALTSGGIGVHLNRSAANSFIEGAGATLSGWNYGIEDDADNVVVTNMSADNNGTAGFLVQRAAGVAIANFGAHGNGQYGVLLTGAALSQVSGGTVNPPAIPGIQNNGVAGIQVMGISKPFRASTGNRVFGNCVTGNLGAGIALDKGVLNSKVSGNEATGNTGDDLTDVTNNCGSNLWFGNSYGVGNPVTCIGQSVTITPSLCPTP